MSESETQETEISDGQDNGEIDNDFSKARTNASTVQSASPSKLTPDLIEKAEIEVNEKETWRERDIQALREIVLGMKFCFVLILMQLLIFIFIFINTINHR